MERETSGFFKREIGALQEIVLFINDYFMKEKIEPAIHPEIDLAVEEIFTNFVRHNPSGATGIGVVLACDDTELRVTLTDFDSSSYDLTQRAEIDVDRPLAERQPGGLGIHLVRKLMDRVEYEYENRESRVTLYKRLDRSCSKSQ